VAGELVRDGFTVMFVEAIAGARALTAVVEEAGRLAPALVVLEDLDLWCRDRSSGGGGGLSELLQAMDISPAGRVLTLASTNAADTLDAAAIRTGLLDSVLLVGYPDFAADTQILTALIDGLPGGVDVDTSAVAVALPERTSGSDLREIVRRAMLGLGQVSTAGLLGEINAGRYRPVVSGVGAYL
jgi:SpoVK/Ycf46/Vps4 family AAA+-type ATPase